MSNFENLNGMTALEVWEKGLMPKNRWGRADAEKLAGITGQGAFTIERKVTDLNICFSAVTLEEICLMALLWQVHRTSKFPLETIFSRIPKEDFIKSIQSVFMHGIDSYLCLYGAEDKWDIEIAEKRQEETNFIIFVNVYKNICGVLNRLGSIPGAPTLPQKAPISDETQKKEKREYLNAQLTITGAAIMKLKEQSAKIEKMLKELK